MAAVPTPRVPASAYDETYYREWCAGYDVWVASDGAQAAGIYPGFLAKAELRPGETVVDVGTGRGELLAVAVQLGAAHAYGIEYSNDAVRMAEQTLRQHHVGDRAEVLLCDARSTGLPSGVADLVCFVDVVEHLTPSELHTTLREAHRLLRPGGRAVAHTTPNRFIYDRTYPVLRWVIGRGRWPKDPRNELERRMHVNEQSAWSLGRAFRRAGFDVRVTLGDWIHTEMIPSRRGKCVYHALAKLGPLAHLGVGDLWAVGRR